MAQQRRHHTHEHYLSYVVPPYEHGYKCDICGVSGKGQVWHCQPCSYDLCDNCIKPAEVQAPLPALRDFDEDAFKSRVNNALARVRTILENTRTPTLASEVHHEYEDKFLLAEYIGNTTIASILQIFEAIGMNEKIFQQLKEWSTKRSVTLRLKAEETCKFLRKTVREVESDTKYVSNSTLFGKSESYTVTKITEWFWAFEARYELIAFMGNEPEKGLVLLSRAGATELKTTSENTPRPASVVKPNIDVNISWLFGQVEATGRTPRFVILRNVPTCRTPRRNSEVDNALVFLTSLFTWCRNVHSYFVRDLWPADPDHGLDLSGMKDIGLFLPVVPLFDKSFQVSKDGSGKGTGVVPIAYIGPFLAEQQRSINEKWTELAKVFPAQGKLITLQESKLIVMLLHLQKLCQAFGEGVDSIENMLYRQLVAAIGKEVHPLDFANYMRFHNRKLFRGDFLPLPFSYAIRRAGHDPEGTLSIEAAPSDGSISEPIQTIVRHTAFARHMKFALDASTEVKFGGDRYLHGYVSHQFGGVSGATLSLRARARQFSSYILLVGSIASAELFIPKFGIIVQNKDELRIPLNLDTIPTPKEFKDAIESLSPEQQRFAKAFRSMQLESTLFGVCVIQIKPQLERLLNLPPDALTKEIQLATDLQTLFIEYQMPSDLLSFDGDKYAPLATKVARVKVLCQQMMDTINKEKDEQLRIERQKQELRLAEERRQREEEERRRQEQERERMRRQAEEMQSLRLESESAPRYQSSGSGKGFLSAVTSAVRGAISPRAYSASSAPSNYGAAADFAAAPAPMMSAPMPVAAPAPTVQAQAPASPAPSQPSQPVEKPKIEDPKQPKDERPKEKETSQQLVEAESEDYTKVPPEMEKKFETLDEDSALRPTIISAGNVWTKRYQKALLAKPETMTLNKDEQSKERNRAFDLLDALTKSGAMPVAEADLHVVIASTHCFEKTLMNTLVQNSVNPIEKVERSALIVATTVHRRPAVELIQEEQVQRVATYSPKLIDAAALQPVPAISSAVLQPIGK